MAELTGDSWLTEELVALGHQVICLRAGFCHARGSSHVANSARARRPRCAIRTFHMSMIEQIAQRAREFDLPHFHLIITRFP
jgi:hypothetical protein